MKSSHDPTNGNRSEVQPPPLEYEQKDITYSWKGSPNAGKVLTIVAVLGALLVLFAGFSY
ncbi:MAG: hypothetical protein HC924_07825 [Synechococcaceae cyanobacterium SM2_3_2]|nr:hypothetical protein [Synechococcaceae cyanobacterium SM2_3_2]